MRYEISYACQRHILVNIIGMGLYALYDLRFYIGSGSSFHEIFIVPELLKYYFDEEA